MRTLLFSLALTALPLAACSLDRTSFGPGGTGLDSGIVDPELDASIDAEPVDAGPRPDTGPEPDAGPEPDGGPDANLPSCTSVDDACTDGVESICNASSGAIVNRPCPLGCDDAGSRCARLVPSNVAPGLFEGDAPAWDVPADVTYDTNACAGGMLTDQLTGGAQQVCVRRVGALQVASGATLRVRGSRPLIVLAQGNVTIAGTVDASAGGVTPGPGGGIAGDSQGMDDGVGRQPGRGGSFGGSYDDGGGGGGGFCGAGGNGGDGRGGGSGGAGGGSEGGGYALEPLAGGSGGGWARGASGMSFDNSADGGAGGGAVQISSRGTITIAAGGAIVAGGGGGRGGGAINAFTTNYGAGGGGGSGGGILLEAETITVSGGARVWTTGGGGGGSADGVEGTPRPGMPGQDGANTGGRAAGGARGGERYGADGGDSGGGGTDDGEDGSDNTSETGTNGGGGGGGVGCIVLRTASGARPGDVTPFSGSTTGALRTLPAERE